MLFTEAKQSEIEKGLIKKIIIIATTTTTNSCIIIRYSRAAKFICKPNELKCLNFEQNGWLKMWTL